LTVVKLKQINRRGGAGIAGSLHVVVTAGALPGTVTDIFSFSVPSLSAIGPANKPTTARAIVTVSGSGLGTADYSASGKMAGTAFESSAWRSDTSILVKVPAGVRTSLRHSLTAGSQPGTATDAFSYDRPHATSAPR